MASDGEVQRIARLTPLPQVLARVAALVAPVTPRAVALASARGCVLAEDVTAPADVPNQALALRDGYAVRADDIADAGPYAPMPLVTPARRVDVGEPLPPDADAVLPFDAVAERGGRHQALAPAAAGDDVLAAGGDWLAGAVIARSGRRIDDVGFAVLAMAGRHEVRVRAPRVGLVARDDDAVHAVIARLIARVLTEAGCLVERSDGLALAASSNDAVVAIGGTGSGRNDTTVRALAAIGTVEAHGIAISPGETAAVGMIGPRPALLLPGRIDAALAAWLTVGQPMIERLTGRRGGIGPSGTAALSRKIASPLGLADVVPVRVVDGKAEPIASGYWPLAALSGSEGWILIGAESEGCPAGDEVVIRPWP